MQVSNAIVNIQVHLKKDETEEPLLKVSTEDPINFLHNWLYHQSALTVKNIFKHSIGISLSVTYLHCAVWYSLKSVLLIDLRFRYLERVNLTVFRLYCPVPWISFHMIYLKTAAFL